MFQKLREAAQNNLTEVEHLQSLLKDKQSEIETCKKEIEAYKIDNDLLKKKNTEVFMFIISFVTFSFIFLEKNGKNFLLSFNIIILPYMKLLQNFQNIDVNEYNRMKEEVNKMQVSNKSFWQDLLCILLMNENR